MGVRACMIVFVYMYARVCARASSSRVRSGKCSACRRRLKAPHHSARRTPIAEIARRSAHHHLGKVPSGLRGRTRDAVTKGGAAIMFTPDPFPLA